MRAYLQFNSGENEILVNVKKITIQWMMDYQYLVIEFTNDDVRRIVPMNKVHTFDLN